MDGDDLFKDYFETLNPDEVLADPICEDDPDDPLGLGPDFNLEALGSSTTPDDLLTPITSLIEDSPSAGGDGLHPSNISQDVQPKANIVDTIIKQELADDVPPPAAPAGPSSSGLGLKIAR